MNESCFGTGVGTPSGRRVLDTAEGVLIGLRRYDHDAAFAELIDASRRHVVPLFAIASALINLARGAERPANTSPRAWSSAKCEWGQLFNEIRWVAYRT